MWPNADRTEKSGKNQLATGDVARTLRHQIVADDTQMRAQVENIPVLLAQNSQAGLATDERITFARNRLDERRFAAAVRTKNRDMLSSLNRQ